MTTLNPYCLAPQPSPSRLIRVDRVTSCSRPIAPYTRLYRAHVEPNPHGRGECTAFVEAAGHRDATRKIAAAVAALEGCLPETIENRIYNCVSARELMDEGLSKDVDLRLFETGWCGGKATHFVEAPLFLMSAPALIRKWAEVSGVSHG